MTKLTKIKYKIDDGFCETPCPVQLKRDTFSKGNPEYFHGTMVGSTNCEDCQHYGGETTHFQEDAINCDHPEV